MFTLTLTNKERAEIVESNPYPWESLSPVGELRKLLFQCEWTFPGVHPDDMWQWEDNTDEFEWDEADEITFEIPHDMAMRISELIDEVDDCFSEKLQAKLLTLQHSIV